MTNDKKAKELGDKFARQYHHNNYPEFSSNSEFVFSNKEIEKACNEMANWKDQQFQEEKKQLIKRASDWWELMLRQGNPEIQKCLELMIEQFKQAMEK